MHSVFTYKELDYSYKLLIKPDLNIYWLLKKNTSFFP